MRRLLVRLGGLCLLTLLTAGCQRTFVFLNTPTSPANVTSSAERTASITQIKGTVETRSSANGTWKPAAQDQVLAEGSEVRTGPGSSAVISLTEGSHIYVGANTLLTLMLLNKFIDSLLTTLDLKQGQVWVVLNGGALDVQTPFGIATARNAYLSVDLAQQSRALNVTCLQGVCGFGTILIPSGYKLANAADNASPEQMQLADYGVWGVKVPEATQLAFSATEAIVQGSATMPAVPSPTATASPRPTLTATPTPPPTETETLAPNTSSATVEPPTETATLETPTLTPVPSWTLPPFNPTVTPVPFTPLPRARIIGHHIVQPGDTVFCIGRGYGVLPAAIAQANDLSYPSYFIATNQILQIPEVQWIPIPAGPVCPPQFTSPFPGLTVPTPTPPASPTPAGPPLTVSLNFHCTANCGSKDGTYILHFDVIASGGVEPYIYQPAQSFDVFDLPHCQTGQGSVTVTSADGQVVTTTWSYIDSACPPK